MKTALLTVLATLAAAVPAAHAQQNPTKPIRLIAPFAPGGSPPDPFHQFIRRDVEKWRRVVRDG